MYTYTFIHAITIHECEGELDGIYKRVWSEEREGIKCCNYSLKNKIYKVKIMHTVNSKWGHKGSVTNVKEFEKAIRKPTIS